MVMPAPPQRLAPSDRKLTPDAPPQIAAATVPSTTSIDQCTAAPDQPMMSSRVERLATRAIAPAHYASLDATAMRRALIEAAYGQMRRLSIYNAAYAQIAFPAGDVSAFYGVCTDVVIRAYRQVGIDLQALVQAAGVGSGDRSIDHRRTEVLRKFLAAHGQSIPMTPGSGTFLPGDIVTYYRPQNRTSTSHMAMVTDRIGPSGQSMVIHNRGWGVQVEDALFVDKMTGHYRLLSVPQHLLAKMEAALSSAGLRPPAIGPLGAAVPMSAKQNPQIVKISVGASDALERQ